MRLETIKEIGSEVKEQEGSFEKGRELSGPMDKKEFSMYEKKIEEALGHPETSFSGSATEKIPNNQKEVQKTDKETPSNNMDEMTLGYSIDSRINRSGDVSFAGGCASFCKKTVTDSTDAHHSGR